MLGRDRLSQHLSRLTIMFQTQPGMQRSTHIEGIEVTLRGTDVERILPILTIIALKQFSLLRATRDDLKGFLTYIRPLIWELTSHSNLDVSDQANAAIDVIDAMLLTLPFVGSSLLPVPVANGPIALAFCLLPEADQALVEPPLGTARLEGAEGLVQSGRVFGGTQVGRIKSVNEDVILVSDDTVLGQRLLLVLDGKTEAEDGEWAPAMAARSIYAATRTLGQPLAESIVNAGNELEAAYRQNQTSDDGGERGISMVAVSIAADNRAQVVRVGDAKAYLIRNNWQTVQLLSGDDSKDSRLGGTSSSNIPVVKRYKGIETGAIIVVISNGFFLSAEQKGRAVEDELRDAAQFHGDNALDMTNYLLSLASNSPGNVTVAVTIV
ncbi:MAG: hypothetical protein WC890_06390 [Candidatus Margulisiibacteriota bacterium]